MRRSASRFATASSKPSRTSRTRSAGPGRPSTPLVRSSARSPLCSGSASPESSWSRTGGDVATGVYAELNGEPAAWWADVHIDLRNEPSGVASAVFDAAPVTVYDVGSSPRISPRLAAKVGAKSGAWVPMLAENRVIGVLVFASTDTKRTFAPDELALLQATASEAAAALERLRSAAALSEALAREQLVGEVARRIRAQLDPTAVLEVAREELGRALGSTDVSISVDGEARVICDRELPAGERFFVDTVEREVDAALHTARLLAENRQRLDQQAALLHAAQVVTSELEIEGVLERLVQEVTKLLDADAADCYLVDAERGVLRCAAVHGFDATLVGSEFSPPPGALGSPGPEPCVRGVRACTRCADGVGGRDPRRARRRGARPPGDVLRGRRRAARGVRLARVAGAPQRRELRRAVAPGSCPARLLSHRLAAR